MPDSSNKPASNDHKLFYGWVIAIAGAATVFSAASFQYTFGVFVKPLADSFDWSRAAISGSVSGRSIISSIYAPFVGAWSDKYGPRKFILLGVVLAGLSYVLASRTTSIWLLYLSLSVLMGVGLTSAFIPVVATVTRWFGKRAAVANGIVMSGFGVAQMVLPPIETLIIVRYGWEWCFLLLGLFVWLVGIIAWRFIKSPPSAATLSVGTTKENTTRTPPKAIASAGDYSLAEALRNSIFWVMLVINAAAFLTYQMAVIHVVPAAIQTGITPEAAAIVLTLGGVGSTCGRLGLGALAGRLGTKPVLIFCLALQVVALFFLTGANSLYVFYGSAIFLGFGYGGVIPIMPTMAGGYFGLKAMGSIFGVINIAQNVGLSIGPLLAGFIFDITGSYFYAFLTAAILMIIALILSLILRPPRKKAVAA